MTIADLERALDNVERILLDSSSVMALHSPHEATHALVEHLFGRIARDDDPLHAYISVISVSELLIRPHRTSYERFTFMHEFLMTYPNLTVLPVDTTVAVEAATLRSVMRSALPDAVVIANGLLSGCQAIISNDARWRRGASLFPQFRWIYLGDYL